MHMKKYLNYNLNLVLLSLLRTGVFSCSITSWLSYSKIVTTSIACFLQVKRCWKPLHLIQSINCKSCVFLEFFGIVSKKFENNEEIIYDLLDAQSMVFQWHKHERKDIEIAILRNELAYTAWERDKLAFYHGLGEQDKIMSQREEFFLDAMTQNIPVKIQQNITVRREVSKGRTNDLL